MKTNAVQFVEIFLHYEKGIMDTFGDVTITQNATIKPKLKIVVTSS